MQWTEHTNQGTAPDTASAAAGYAPAQPAYGTAPAQPAYGGPASAAPGSPSAPLTAESFVADLKRFEGFAIMVVCVGLFIAFSFFSWFSVEATNPQTGQSASSSSNAWDSEGAWLIRGWEPNLENLQKFESGISVDSGTDMVILLPIALAAVGVAAAVRLGKQINKGAEIAVGLSALLAVLMVAELVHLNSAADEVKKIYAQFGVSFDGGPAFGLYTSLLAALAMTIGAFRMYQASRQSG